MGINKKTKRSIGGTIVIIIVVAIAMFTNNEHILIGMDEVLGTEFSNIIKSETVVEKEESKEKEYKISEDLKVHFIDVGQADSILIENQGETMLIDAGNNDDGEKVVEFIKNQGINKLDYVVGTHPHEDHIGGLDDVIDSLDVENVIMPKIQTNTRTFEDVLDAVENKKLTITSPKKGDKYTIGEANCEVLNDSILDKSNLNLSSIMMQVEFGSKKFLFTGDAESENEKTVSNWEKIDVLKVGHHGSTTSSSAGFLKQIKPDVAVIMVGEDNDYGHPKQTILKRLENIGSKIYRTDKNGTITIKTDGEELIINTEKEN